MADQPPPAAVEAASAAADDLSSKVASMNMTGSSDGGSGDGAGKAGSKKKKKGGGGGGNNGNGSNSSSKKPPPPPPREWTPEMQADYDRILSVGEECISATELRGLITAKGRGSDHAAGFNLYDGFEPSGRMHIAQVSVCRDVYDELRVEFYSALLCSVR